MYQVAIEILNILNNNNYEAYIVGGFVRDKLLNIESDDIDIITNAKPNDIKDIFNLECDNNYGSIVLKYKGFKYDITTFREEFDYIDNRRPSKINYVKTLEEDLKRRDFTINSICIDKDGKYIDLFNGIDDLKNKLLITIDNPTKKIKQDSLRILRAIRFSSMYNLNMDNDLKQAIKANYNLVSNLSFDRIKKELDVVFNSNYCDLYLNMINEFNLFEILQIKPKNSVICTGNYLSIWAQLEYSNNYNFSSKEKKAINEIKSIINIGNIDNYILYKYNFNNIEQAAKILKIENFNRKIPIHSRKDININYDDIINLNMNLNINEIYIDLEKQILYNKLKNEKENILIYIINKYKEGDNNE